MKPGKIAAVAFSCLVFLFFSAQAQAAEPKEDMPEPESTLERILKRGSIRVGMDTFVPWAMKDKTGKFIGFEIDVAARLAKDMEVTLELVPTKWSGIIPALLTGKFDVLIGGMSIRPDRNKKVNFTIPYYYSGMSVLAHKELAGGFDKLSDFNDPAVTVVARLGTTAAAAARKHMPRAKLKLFDAEPQALQEILNAKAHAFVSMAPLPAFEAIKHPDKLFLPLKKDITREPNGFAVRKGDVDTLNYFNGWIRVVQAEGWFRERQKYWFESRDWEDQLK